jgi:hypothetical protein
LLRKTFHYTIAIILVAVIGYLVVDFFLTGFRIMLFGSKLMIFPIAITALAFMLWRIRKK